MFSLRRAHRAPAPHGIAKIETAPAAAPNTPAQPARAHRLNTIAPQTPGGVVQRKVGFEFESTGDEKWRFQGKDPDDEKYQPIGHTKAMLVPIATGLGGISADNGNVEMRTEPLSTWAEVDATIGALQGMVATYQGRETILTGEINTAAAKKTGKASNRIVASAEFQSKPQATLGVAMANIDTLFEQFLTMANTAREDSLEAQVANSTTLNAMVPSVDVGKDILSTALDLYQERIRDPDYIIENVAEAEGFMATVLKTLYDAWSNSGSDLTDPKYAFTLMPRTDFKSMFASMSDRTRTQIMDFWNSGVLLTSFDRNKDKVYKKFSLDAPVFPGGYTTEEKTPSGGKKRSKGPTVRAWLTSIFTGADPKDLLSPPPGFPRHGVNPEGLGAHGTDRTQPALSLFELRNLTNGNPVTTKEWKPLARIVSSIAATTQNDAGLRPT